MTPTLALSLSIVELRAWLKVSQDLLQRLSPASPEYQAGLVIWQQRIEAYEARVRAEGEPE